MHIRSLRDNISYDDSYSVCKSFWPVGCYTDLNKGSDLTSVLLFGATVNGDLLRDKYVRCSALQLPAQIKKKSRFLHNKILKLNTTFCRFGRSIGSVLVVAEIAWPPTKWVILIGSLLSTVGAGMQSLTG